MVFVLALGLGFVNVFDNPARQSLIPELVPPAQLRNAVTLNSVIVNLARIFGAAAGGAIASVSGPGPVLRPERRLLRAVVISLALMSGGAMFGARRETREPGQIRAGLRYVRTEPELLVPLLMIAVIGALAWEFPISLPLLARPAFHGGAGTYGAMTAVMGAGAVVGGLITASRNRVRRRGLAIAAARLGRRDHGGGARPGPAAGVRRAAVRRLREHLVQLAGQDRLQLSATPGMRGRVMSLWSVAWLGSTPVGGPLIGWIGQEFGGRWSLIVGGLPTLVVGIAMYPVLARVDARRAGRGLPRRQAPGPPPRAEPRRRWRGLCQRGYKSTPAASPLCITG